MCRWLDGPIWIRISQFYRSLARAIWMQNIAHVITFKTGWSMSPWLGIWHREFPQVFIHVFLQFCFCGFRGYSCPLSIPKFRKSYLTLSSTALFSRIILDKYKKDWVFEEWSQMVKYNNKLLQRNQSSDLLLATMTGCVRWIGCRLSPRWPMTFFCDIN